jgi:hypothetical protein
VFFYLRGGLCPGFPAVKFNGYKNGAPCSAAVPFTARKKYITSNFCGRERGILLSVTCRLITKEYTMNRKSLKAFFPGFAARAAAMGL